jgi:hypothetical protein
MIILLTNEYIYIHLLVIGDHIKKCSINHYVYIKKIDVFVIDNKFDKEGKHVCDKRFICCRCLYPFSTKEGLENHITNGCDKFEPTRVVLPNKNNDEVPATTFEHFYRKIKVPAVIYADFESLITKPNKTDFGENTTAIAELPPCSYAFNIVSDYPELNFGLELYRGDGSENVVVRFLKSLLFYGDIIKQILQKNTPMIITEEQEKQFQECDICYLCEKPVVNKVRDHDHITGFYRGCACNQCNINFNYKNFKIPIFSIT